MLIVMEEIFLLKEFVVFYFMRNIYTYIEFGGLQWHVESGCMWD